MTLRPYQSSLKNAIFAEFSQNKKKVCAVAPCGAGKTVIMADVFRDHREHGLAIAHRQELVGQISMALARAGVFHRLIAPSSVISFISGLHFEILGKAFLDQTSPIGVAGVDTLIRNFEEHGAFLRQITLWQIDEGHHVVPGNKWQKAVEKMPLAKGIGWTATPARADKKPLGDVYDAMVLGPEPAWLIQNGFLCPYKVFVPPSDVDLSTVNTTASGDFNQAKLAEATKRSHIVGDVVEQYLKIMPGERHVTFAVDVELAHEHAASFNQKGVPAAVLHAKTSDYDRQRITSDFAAGILKEIVNVDVLGEGYDCPGIVGVSLARATESLALAIQQMMRAMRIMQGKECAYIIDHVGNIRRHGLPDTYRQWDINKPEPQRRARGDDMPWRECRNPLCLRGFESWGKTCPYCGWKPVAVARERPEQVEGDLTELSEEALAKLRKEVDLELRAPRLPLNAAPVVRNSINKNHRSRLQAVSDLRRAMDQWAGVRAALGDDDSTLYKRFFAKFGTDPYSAQKLRAGDITRLHEQIKQSYEQDWANQ